jgi:hypothetical protein
LIFRKKKDGDQYLSCLIQLASISERLNLYSIVDEIEEIIILFTHALKNEEIFSHYINKIYTLIINDKKSISYYLYGGKGEIFIKTLEYYFAKY